MLWFIPGLITLVLGAVLQVRGAPRLVLSLRGSPLVVLGISVSIAPSELICRHWQVMRGGKPT